MKKKIKISLILGAIVAISLYYVITDVLFRPCCAPPEIETQSDILLYYETDADGNLIKPETTDWLFDKEKELAEIFEDSTVPHCEYDFAYMKGITDIVVMCYKGNWYVIHDGWTNTPYRLPG